MKLRSATLLLLLALPALAQRPDAPGCTDPKLFPTRMPNYRISSCKTREFDVWKFRVSDNGRDRQSVEGRFTEHLYQPQGKDDAQSALAVVRNYENALKRIGGKTVAVNTRGWLTGMAVIDGKEAWVEVDMSGSAIWLRIVEKKEMAQHITADAKAFADDLKATGHVAVYGIYFDTGKSDLKPESTPALEEITKLLKADAALKLWVVGHTDSVSTIESNMKLSEARAQAVVTALTTKHGVAAARLKGYGVGPLAPVTSNDTEEGRAKNRRVELVKQ